MTGDQRDVVYGVRINLPEYARISPEWINSLNRYKLGDVVAVQWNPELAEQFPNARHTGCRQQCWHDGEQWREYHPARCMGYHCPKCGEPTNMMGNHHLNPTPGGKCNGKR